MGCIDKKTLKESVNKDSYKNICIVLGALAAFLTVSPDSIYSSVNLETFAYVLLCVLSFWLCLKGGKNNTKNKNAILLCAICFAFAFIPPIFIHFEIPFVTDMLQWLALLLIISIKEKFRERILNTAVNFLTVIISLATIEYVIGYVTGVSITLGAIEHGESLFSHSIFNLYRDGHLQQRFQALSDEPGHVGALCGFMVGFLPFDRKYKKKIVIFLLAGLLSLSLAFYIYFIFIIIFKLITRQIGFNVLIMLLTVLAMMVYFFREPIQKTVIERVIYKDEVDNRTSKNVNKFIENLFTTSETFYGVGNRTAYNIEKDSGYGNAGLKWKIFQYGVLGVGFYFLGMFFLYRRFRNRHVSMSFSIIFFLLYFYSVGSWGIPIFMLLLFTTLPINKQIKKDKSTNCSTLVVFN